jgi:hypothetical protein
MSSYTRRQIVELLRVEESFVLRLEEEEIIEVAIIVRMREEIAELKHALESALQTIRSGRSSS